MRTFIIILSILAIHSELFGQNKKIVVYNVAFSAITSGVGSAINKKPGEKIGHAFLNGVWKGAIGGGLTYTGKALTCKIIENKNLSYAWPAKIIHSTGVSIIENACSNSGFLNEWHIELGFLRTGFNFKSMKPSTRIVLSRIYGFMQESQLGSFNLNKSIQSAQFYFILRDKNFDDPRGINFYTSIGVANFVAPNEKYKVAAHEIIHCYQTVEQMSVIKTFDKKLEPLNKFKSFRAINKVFYLENFIGQRVYLKVNKYSAHGDYNKMYNEVEAHYLTDHLIF